MTSHRDVTGTRAIIPKSLDFTFLCIVYFLFQVFVEERRRGKKHTHHAIDGLCGGMYMNVCHHVYSLYVHQLSSHLVCISFGPWFIVPINVLNSNYPQCDSGLWPPNTSGIQSLASITFFLGCAGWRFVKFTCKNNLVSDWVTPEKLPKGVTKGCYMNVDDIYFLFPGFHVFYLFGGCYIITNDWDVRFTIMVLFTND